MNRIDAVFRGLRASGGKAVMPFITGGYPSPEAMSAVLPALERGGAAVCEIGFPFSDPIADGPVIQASMTEALAAGVTPARVFEAVRGVRGKLKLGLVAMVSYSIVYRIGAERFVARASEAGFDGFIFPDLPLEEAAGVSAVVRDAGMVSSLLISPTTPDDRAARIAEACTGFLYILARTGITGERADLPEGLEGRLQRLRRVTDLPMAVGFGISTPQHVRAVTRVADAAIVGSALVRRMTAMKESTPEDLAAHVEGYLKELSGGVA